jgi:DNA-directed RNA polymerase subunit RPC12/RpoP
LFIDSIKWNRVYGLGGDRFSCLSIQSNGTGSREMLLHLLMQWQANPKLDTRNQEAKSLSTQANQQLVCKILSIHTQATRWKQLECKQCMSHLSKELGGPLACARCLSRVLLRYAPQEPKPETRNPKPETQKRHKSQIN